MRVPIGVPRLVIASVTVMLAVSPANSRHIALTPSEWNELPPSASLVEVVDESGRFRLPMSEWDTTAHDVTRVMADLDDRIGLLDKLDRRSMKNGEQIVKANDRVNKLRLLSSISLPENTTVILDVLSTGEGTVITSGPNAPNALNGKVSIIDGKLSYTPTADSAGSDFIIFETTDGTTQTDWVIPATVTGVEHDTVTQAADGSTTTEHFDSTGTTVSARTDHPNGSYDLATYKVEAMQTYKAETDSYDADGNLTGTAEFAPDGSVMKTSTVTAEPDGSTVTSIFDPSGRLEQVSTLEADGTKDVIDHIGSENPVYGRTVESFYDVAGRLTKQTFRDRSGSIYEIGASAVNADGSWTESVTDPSGRMLLARNTTHSDGSQDRMAFGIQGQLWTTTLARCAPSGALQSEHLLAADGSTFLSGTASTDPFGTVTVDYRPNGDRTSALQTTKADGASEITVRGIVGQAYASEDSRYDDAGHLSYRSFGYADGSSRVDERQPGNTTTKPDHASVDHYDAAGLLAVRTGVAEMALYTGGKASCVAMADRSPRRPKMRAEPRHR